MNSKSVQFEYNTTSEGATPTKIVDSERGNKQHGANHAVDVPLDISPGIQQRAKQQPIKERRYLPEPPVTKTTLSELDVNKIVNNPKLRHDINFDPDLHFRPNLDGEKGRRKSEKASGFWDTMRNQLQDYLVSREYFQSPRRLLERIAGALRGDPLEFVPLKRRPLKCYPGFNHRHTSPNDHEMIERYKTVYSSKQQPPLQRNQCRRGQEDV